MNKPRIIKCQKCNQSQDWNRQINCVSCGKRLNDWSVATQLGIEPWRLEENRNEKPK